MLVVDCKLDRREVVFARNMLCFFLPNKHFFEVLSSRTHWLVLDVVDAADLGNHEPAAAGGRNRDPRGRSDLSELRTTQRESDGIDPMWQPTRWRVAQWVDLQSGAVDPCRGLTRKTSRKWCEILQKSSDGTHHEFYMP